MYNNAVAFFFISTYFICMYLENWYVNATSSTFYFFVPVRDHRERYHNALVFDHCRANMPCLLYGTKVL